MSAYVGLNSESSMVSVGSNRTPPWLGQIEYSRHSGSPGEGTGEVLHRPVELAWITGNLPTTVQPRSFTLRQSKDLPSAKGLCALSTRATIRPPSHKPSGRNPLRTDSSAQGYAPTVSTSRAQVNAVQAQTQTTQEQDRCQVLSNHRGNGDGQRHSAVSSRKVVNDSSQQHVQQPSPYHRVSFRRKRTDNSATCRNRFPAEWAALYMCSYLLPAIRAAAGFAPFSLYRVGHYRSDTQ